jgi:hypothetical protein
MDHAGSTASLLTAKFQSNIETKYVDCIAFVASRDSMPCSQADSCRRFGGILYVHLPHFALSLQSLWALVSIFFSLMIILQTVGLLGRVISSSQGRYLNTGQHKHRINTYTYETSTPCVRFEPTIPAFKRVKTVDALDRSATVTGRSELTNRYIFPYA